MKPTTKAAPAAAAKPATPPPTKAKIKVPKQKSFVYEYETYAYPDDLIERFLTLMVRDDTFLHGYRSVVNEEFFENGHHRLMSQGILGYFDKYRLPPDKTQLNNALEAYISTHPNYQDVKGLKNTLERVFRHKIVRSRDALREQMVSFGKHQAIKAALTESYHNLMPHEEKHGDIENVLRLALAIGSDVSDLGIDFLEDLSERSTWRKVFNKRRIKTGIKQVDDCLDGGAGPGEVCMVMAPTNYGKSTTALRIMVEALHQGKKAVYYTLEQSARKIANKADCAILYKPAADVRKMSAQQIRAEANWKRLASNLKDAFKIKYFPPDTHTIQDIRSHLHNLKAIKGFVPDIVVIDSPDLLVPTGHRAGKQDEWEALGTIYNSVCHLAAELDIPIWVTSDTVKQAWGKQSISVRDIGNSYKKARKVDVIMALSSTENSHSQGVVNLDLVKVRDGEAKKGEPIALHFDWAKSTWTRQGTFEEGEAWVKGIFNDIKKEDKATPETPKDTSPMGVLASDLAAEDEKDAKAKKAANG